jgi:glycosyltransferase involved in cell wall biosynthesis
MRVLHIDTERGWRGGERQALWLATELAHRGHYSMIAARPGEPLAQRAAGQQLQLLACTPIFEADPRAVLQLRRSLVRWRPDIVHAHTGHAVGLGALATIGTRIPMIVTRRVDFHLRRSVGTRWKYRQASAIIAVSQAVANVLVVDGIDPRKIVVVPDGTDIYRRLEPASPQTLASLGIPAGAPLVVQVAQLVPHKDPLNFVRAIAEARRRVPSVQGLLVGDGPLRHDIERAIQDLALTDSFHLAGYREDADALLAASSVVVLSSREEGLGSVLLDALLLGKAIAATRAGGIPDVIEHGVTGLLASIAAPSDLGDHIASLLLDRALATRLQNAARERAKEFSVDRMTDRTLAVYERVLSGSSGDRAATSRRTDAATRARSSDSIRAP